MDVRYDSDIPAFRRYATMLYVKIWFLEKQLQAIH
jgi:hypothetical protein